MNECLTYLEQPEGENFHFWVNYPFNVLFVDLKTSPPGVFLCLALLNLPRCDVITSAATAATPTRAKTTNPITDSDNRDCIRNWPHTLK